MFLTPDQRIINKSTTIYADMIHILIEITKWLIVSTFHLCWINKLSDDRHATHAGSGPFAITPPQTIHIIDSSNKAR